EHLGQPLVLKSVGAGDEQALAATEADEKARDQARLDGFAQTDLVGKQKSRRVVLGRLPGDEELMVEKLDSAGGEQHGFEAAAEGLDLVRVAQKRVELGLVPAPAQEILESRRVVLTRIELFLGMGRAV